MTVKQKGDLTELQCITAFYELGCGVSIPYGENSRYDFIADVKGKLLKIQVKTSRPLHGGDTITFSCRSTRISSTACYNRRYTSEEIDFFATFYDGKCYLVPVGECGTDKLLRLEPTKNGQVAGVHYVSDYELLLQIQKITQP